MKILVGAWACNPRQGSEAAVGWSWLAAIKDQHDVHVLTALYQRDWIESELRERPADFSRVRFHYVEPRFWQYSKSPFWLWQANIPALVPLFHRYYHRWMRAAHKTAVQLHREITFDLVHQLTFVGFRFPGHLWKLNAPFVWGPIGGLENMPWRFLPELGPGGAIHYTARNLVNSYHKNYLRAPLKAFRRARAIIAATSRIQAEIFRCYGVASEVICEVGLPAAPASEFTLRTSGEPIRIAWSGLHQSRKALPILLRAMRVVAADYQLDIYGDGPCNREWRELAARLGIDSRCTWHGQVSREDAMSGIRRAHLFAITSLQDLTSTVLVEALAQGVPVICPDHCGFSDVINETCGIKLPIPSLRELERRLAGAITALADDEDRRRRLAAGALLRVRDYSWEAKAAAINRVYERARDAASVPSPASLPLEEDRRGVAEDFRPLSVHGETTKD